jgi:hypothetical protein
VGPDGWPLWLACASEPGSLWFICASEPAKAVQVRLRPNTNLATPRHAPDVPGMRGCP